MSDVTGVTSPYTACTLILPDGTTCKNKSVRTINLMSVETALERLRGNQTAWVAPADADTVLDKLAGKV